jgi:hypothetical protein
MTARFRIRTRDGEEIEPKSVEIFAELVRTGVIRSDDLVYDALTGEWAPAGTHPMVQLFLDPLVDPSVEGAEAGTGEVTDDLTLDLVEEPDISPEEQARAFIEKMEEERRSDLEGQGPEAEAPLLETGSGVVKGLVPASRASTPRAWSDDTFAGPSPGDAAPSGGSASGSGRGSGERRSLMSWGLILAAVALPVLALSLYAASRHGPSPAGDDAASVPPAEDARAPRVVPRTEEQIRSEAFSGFLQRMDALRRENRIDEVPNAWLEGYYLADPGAYPQVRDFWQRYLVYAEAAQADEAQIYREAYLDAANAAGLSGPVKSLRLASALEAFSSRWSRREAHYARVRELAEAALSLDDLMTRLKGRISYEPIRGERVSADPVIEAAGTDAEAQAELEAALDQVLTALHGAGGSTALNRDAVPGWVVEGLAKLETSQGEDTLPPPPESR